ncbi:MAG: hypothetical protein AAB460_00740 [Patescibacteria group bacterium]
MQTYPTVKLTPLTGFANDKRKEGWELLEDEPLVGEPVLTLAEFLRDGEEYVGGEEMVTRATALDGTTGQRHAEQLLGQQKDIPEEYRQFALVFTGTIWRRPEDSGRRVTCLIWGCGAWYLKFFWLGRAFGRYFRLVRLELQ